MSLRTIFVAFVVTLVAFVAIAEVARQPGIPPLDAWGTARLHELANPSLDLLMSAVTSLGSTLVLASVAGLAIVLLLAGGRGVPAAFVAVALVGSLVLNDGLKLVYQRARPAFDWAEHRPEYSFPSGHAMNAFVLYVAIGLVVWWLWGRRAGVAAMALAVALAVAVASSRVYLGVHWLTDVIGGVVAGILWLLVAGAAFAAAVRRAPSRPGSGTSPRGDDDPQGPRTDLERDGGRAEVLGVHPGR